MTETAAPDVEPLLTRKQVAAIDGVPESTIRTWDRNGEIPAGFPVGKHLRWDPSAIRDDIKRRRDEAERNQRTAVGQ